MISEVKYYLSLFLRRLHYFLFIFITLSAIGAVLAYTLPPVYRAQARLLVESPQIPDDLAASTVRAGASELLRVIQQRLLTRTNLLDIAQKFDIYKEMPDMTADEIVGDMRDRIEISLPSARETTGIVVISFMDSDPVLTSDVTNELVTQVLQRNVELRTTASGQTLDFFEKEVARLDTELGQQGSRILEFKLEHKDALPESLDYRRSRLAALQERVLQINREFSSLTDRRSRLDELFEQTGRVDLSDASLTPEERRLRELQDQLASALVIYSPTNPRIRSLKSQVTALEEAVRARAESPEAPSNQLVTAYDLQVSDINGQIDFLAEQKELVEEEMTQLVASINETPENAIQLGTLERDYENIRMQFNQATSALSEARTGDRIEALSKGQRIDVIEQATTPSDPFKPNRKLILAGGVGAGMAGGLGLIFLLELLNKSIRRPVELVNQLGVQPFGALPYMTTRRGRIIRRLTILAILLAGAILLPTLLYLIHSFIIPLDALIEKVFDKLGMPALADALLNTTEG